MKKQMKESRSMLKPDQKDEWDKSKSFYQETRKWQWILLDKTVYFTNIIFLRKIRWLSSLTDFIED